MTKQEKIDFKKRLDEMYGPHHTIQDTAELEGSLNHFVFCWHRFGNLIIKAMFPLINKIVQILNKYITFLLPNHKND